jgi:hypothetical protein
MPNFENLDAKSCNLRVFWSENVFPKMTVLRVFFSPFKYENNEICITFSKVKGSSLATMGFAYH